MDATTKQKTLTGVFVTLLVGSVFVAAIPAAAQPNPSGAGVPVAAVDSGRSTTFTFDAVSYTTQPVIVPTDGILRFNTTYDLTITNISATNLGFGYGYAPVSTGLKLCDSNDFPSSNPRNLDPDLAHSGMFNATFPSQLLNATGVWNLWDFTGTPDPNDCSVNGVMVASFFVYPRDDLTVTLSQSTFTYAPGNTSFTISVGGLASGQTAKLIANGIPAGTTVSFNQPNYIFFGPLPEAGAFPINATVDTGGSSLPERMGTATYTINAAGITIASLNTTVRAGFIGNASWNATYPNGQAVFKHSGTVQSGSDGLNTFKQYNLSVTLPGSAGVYYWNDTDAAPPTWKFYNATTSGTGIMPDPSYIWANAPLLEFGDWGVIYFSPNSTGQWPAGQYTFNLWVNTANASSFVPEYTTSWTFTPATPLDVNVDVFLDSVTPENVSVKEVIGGDSNVTIGPPGRYQMSVVVTGATQSTHPTNGSGTPDDAFDPYKNVSITGDVMVLGTRTYDTTAPGTGTGTATINGVSPTRGGGTITVTVTWRGTTTTTTIPIVHGAVLTASPGELVVDQTSTITFTLKDVFGNPVPDGKVFLFKKPSGTASADLVGANAVNGTGAPGAGQNGQYSLSLKPTVVGDYIAYAIIGRVEGATDFRNFSYATFRVVPAHDVTTTLSTNSAMASVTQPVFINATTTDGVGLPTTAEIYFLHDSKWADFVANGTSALPAANTATNGTLSLGTVSTAGFNVNVTLSPGTYHVYIRSADLKHDNNQSVPTFTVNAFKATFAPDRIPDNPDVQNNVTIRVTVTDMSGNPWNGTLIYDAGASVGKFSYTNASGGVTPSVTIMNGVGVFNATGAKLGLVWFAFDPNSTGGVAPANSLVDGAFYIVGPNITVSPSRVPVGKTSTILTTVRDLNGVALPNLSIRMCGVPLPQTCTENKTTDANGVAQVGVFPTVTGNLTLQINGNATTTNVTVFAGLDIAVSPASPKENDTVTLTVTQVGQTAGESGVSVTVTKDGTNVSGFPQTTGNSGQVVLPSVKQGTYTVTATKPGLEPGSTTFTVGPKPNQTTNEAKFELSNLVAPTTATVGQGVTVSATVKNTGNADGTATLLLVVNDAVRGSQQVPVQAGGSQNVAFDFTPNQAGTFHVTIKLATGETLAEKTITVNTPSGTSPVTSTSPATTTGPATTTPTPTKVPGFEVVALLGALAVALIVLRRKA